jgi:hypothetical protein
MKELHNTENNVKKDIALSAVQSANVLCSNSTFFPDCTADSGIELEKRARLKLLLKDIAKKAINETYEKYRENSLNIHKSVFDKATN